MSTANIVLETSGHFHRPTGRLARIINVVQAIRLYEQSRYTNFNVKSFERQLSIEMKCLLGGNDSLMP